jgi:hypothetical protein
LLLFLGCLVVFTCCWLCGCSVWEYFKREQPPYDAELYATYDETVLKVSSSSGVLPVIHRPTDELLSQSKSVVASAGQKRKGRERWFHMVAFDENKLTARRKYLLIVDDRPNLLEEPRKSVSFDCEMVLDSDVLEHPYANDNARRIAILERVQQNARKDGSEVGPDNELLNTCGMLVNQILEAALVELESSPALAARLSERAGMDFSHVNLDKGKIQMLVEADIVKVKMRLGRLATKWDAEIKKAAEQGQPPGQSYY